MNTIISKFRTPGSGRLILGILLTLQSIVPGQAAVNVTRGPYLQSGTPNSVVLRWRTDAATDSYVRYGASLGSLDSTISDPGITTEHVVLIDGLQPDSIYYYEFGNSAGWFTGNPDDFFVTSPLTGEAVNTRIWTIGDSGTANADAAAVRDAYLNFTGATRTDVWLMLGDNAYDTGTDAQYQTAMFDMYPSLLQNSVVWSTRGNHEQSGGGSTPYYDIFTLPTGGEAGGLASGTEAYYSFDFGNIHFICLDSYGSDRSSGGPMATWLGLDLISTAQDWIIAYWHHPPYTKGSHNSDTEGELIDMRENFLPILEAGGVDLVLTGHSHSYERSKLLDSHFGLSGTLDPLTMVLDGGDGREDGNGAYIKNTLGPASNEGAVYVVAGSSGKIAGGSLNHPAMYISLNNLGSMVIDVFGNRMDAKFLQANGTVADYFTLIKGGTSIPSAPQNLTATSGNTQVGLTWSQSSGADSYNVRRANSSGGPYVLIATDVIVGSYVDVGLVNGTSYYYVVSAVNAIGESADSTEAAATPSAYVDDVATAELTISGNVVLGSYLETHGSDDLYEAISERESGGKPSRRHSLLDHKWTVDVSGGSTVTFFVEAHHTSTAGEEEDFVFAWSSDDVNYADMVVVTKSSDDNSYQSFALPDGLSGTVYIRVRDTDRTQGNKSLDTLFVDDLFVRSDNSSGTNPPSAPTQLMAVPGENEVALSWTPSGGADSYKVYRSDTEGGPYDLLASDVTVSSYLNTGLINGTSYYYVVSAVNTIGESAASNEASATPQPPVLPEPPANLVVSRKGKGKLNLNWTQSTSSGVTQNKVYRSSEGGPFGLVATLAATTSYQDTSVSSGTTYSYQVTAASAAGESGPSTEASGVPR